MHVRKCHLCETDIYPGEKRCRVTIRIFPDQDDLTPWEDEDLEEPCCGSECLAGDCAWDEETEEEEWVQEADLVLCTECQERFLDNPTLKESLLLLRKEAPQKTLH